MALAEDILPFELNAVKIAVARDQGHHHL